MATYSPRNMITGTNIDFNKHLTIIFGAYVQAHEVQVKTNIMQERSHEEIFLGHTGKLKGTYHFLCLNTEEKIT